MNYFNVLAVREILGGSRSIDQVTKNRPLQAVFCYYECMKKYFLVGLMLVVAAGLAGIAYKTNWLSQAEKSSTHSGWLVYANETHGYSVEYPEGWTIEATLADTLSDFSPVVDEDGESYCPSDLGAHLYIHNGDKAGWGFTINQVGIQYGSDSPCKSEACFYTKQDMSVLGYSVERLLVSENTRTILQGVVREKNRSGGFGVIDPTNLSSNSCVEEGSPKYLIVYDGNDIKGNVEILDEITKSLKPLK